jgi:hypothetical protein
MFDVWFTSMLNVFEAMGTSDVKLDGENCTIEGGGAAIGVAVGVGEGVVADTGVEVVAAGVGVAVGVGTCCPVHPLSASANATITNAIPRYFNFIFPPLKRDNVGL